MKSSVLVIAVLSILLVAGCGGDGSSDGGVLGGNPNAACAMDQTDLYFWEQPLVGAGCDCRYAIGVTSRTVTVTNVGTVNLVGDIVISNVSYELSSNPHFEIPPGGSREFQFVHRVCGLTSDATADFGSVCGVLGLHHEVRPCA